MASGGRQPPDSIDSRDRIRGMTPPARSEKLRSLLPILLEETNDQRARLRRHLMAAGVHHRDQRRARPGSIEQSRDPGLLGPRLALRGAVIHLAERRDHLVE